MDLVIEKREVITVNWFTYPWMQKTKKIGLSRFAAQAYGIGRKFQLSESPNDVEYLIEVAEKAEIEELDQPDLDEMLKSKEVPAQHISILLQDMVNKDMLPAGNYLVRVSW